MQKWMPAFYVLSLVMAVPLPAEAQESGRGEKHAPAPRIVCEQPVYEFGEVDNNQIIEHTFVIRNEGDVALEISGVRATCGCTATDVSNRFIEPGETADLTAKLDLRGRQGRQRKAIMVQSNDPKVPTLTLYFDGHAAAEVQLNPRQLFFGRITPDSTVTGMVELVARAGQPIQVLKLETESPLLAVTNRLMPDGISHQLLVTTVAPLPKGAFRGNIRVETDRATHRFMNVPVSGFVVSELTVAPHEIVLPEQPEGAEVRYLLCRSESGVAFEIISVDLPDPAMESRVQPTGPNAYRIEIRNIRPVMDLNEKAVRVTTSLEGGKMFTVPFRIIPQGGPSGP